MPVRRSQKKCVSRKITKKSYKKKNKRTFKRKTKKRINKKKSIKGGSSDSDNSADIPDIPDFPKILITFYSNYKSELQTEGRIILNNDGKIELVFDNTFIPNEDYGHLIDKINIDLNYINNNFKNSILYNSNRNYIIYEYEYEDIDPDEGPVTRRANIQLVFNIKKFFELKKILKKKK